MTGAAAPAGKDPRDPRRARRWLVARMCAAAVLMTGLFVAISVKAWTVQIRDGARMRALGRAQYLTELERQAPRGAILDRSGNHLAQSVAVPSIFADPREVADARAAAAALAPVLGLDERELEDRMSGRRRRFVWLKRRVSEDEAAKVKALGLEGIGITSEAKRLYPGGALAGPLLGFVGSDGQGLEGIELGLDETLAGERARVPVLRDARGRVLLNAGWSEEDAHAAAGADVVLTIDRVIQYSAERALADAVAAEQAKAGVVVVLDAHTSEVLAMATFPSYDPNDPGSHDGARNRPVTDVYEPGSGMKTFTVAIALERGIVRADELIDVDGGRFAVGRKVIRDTHFEKEWLTLGELIQYSSNVGAAKIALRVGKELMAAGLRDFGFGAATGIELPGERRGTVRDTRVWGQIGLATAAYGYGMTVTPLQLAAAIAAIANGGVWRAPRIVRELRGADGTPLPLEEAPSRRVVSEENAAAVLGMLALVMEKGGTGEKIKVPGFRVAGKTGTAYKVDPATKKYSPNKYLSSFVGIVPVEDPRLVILVMIDEPGAGRHYGGAVAGPVFARVASEALKYLGVAGHAPAAPMVAVEAPAPAPELELPPMEDALEPEALADLPPAGPAEEIVVIPDFGGMSVGQAMRAARAAGVSVAIEGSGRAIKQFPPPGRALKSITCRITFDPG